MAYATFAAPSKSRKTKIAKGKPNLKWDLSDPKVDYDLFDEFEKYWDLAPIYETTFNTFNYLDQLFGSATLNRIGSVAPLQNYDAAMDQVWYPMSKNTRYYREDESYVYTSIELPHIPIRTVFASYDVPGFKAGLEDAEKLFQRYFPNFAYPTTFERKEERGENEQLTVKTEFDWKPDTLVSKVFSFDELKKSVKPFESITQFVEAETIEPYEGFQKLFGNSLSFQLEIPASGKYGPELVGNYMESGSLLGSNRVLTFFIKVNAYIRWPKEYAMWVTNTTNDSNYVPSSFVEHVHRMQRFICAAPGRVQEPPRRIGSMAKIKADVTNKSMQLPYTSRPRTNEDDFTIQRNGRVVWAPKIDNIEKYTNETKNLYDRETNTIKETRHVDSIKNILVYVDWVNNKITYTSNEGNTNLIDLLGAIKLDDVTIARWLKMSIASSYFFDTVTILSSHGSSSLLGLLNDIVSRIPNDVEFTIGDLASLNFTDLENGDTSRAVLAEIKEDVKKLYDGLVEADKNFDKLDVPIYTKITHLRFALKLITVYGKDVPKFNSLYSEAVDRNRIKNNSDYTKEFVIPNMPGLESLMPHQVDVVTELDDDPLAAFLDIHPGGGKTPLQTIDIVRLLQKKQIRRPLVIMPGRLVGNFTDDVNTFSKGKMNVFPITTASIERLSKMGLTKKDIVRYIKSMPINTIFVSDYNFCAGKKDFDTGERRMGFWYYDKYVELYPNVHMLHECEFDYVSFDESHNMKSLETKRTKTTAQVAAVASIKREASGTIISNMATDFVGQAALINPSIFGSEDTFKEHVYIDGDPRNGMNPNANKYIRDSLAPYVKRVTKKRSNWAFMLPKINEQFWSVSLTDAQRRFYDGMMEDALDEIRKNPKLLKMLENGDEDDAQKIEDALRRYFAKIEIFINSPDTNAAFKSSIDDESDLISPKVAKVDQLISAHFRGGNIEGINVKASDSKVIVFGLNRDVSAHIMRHSKWRKSAIHYTAGNMDAIRAFKENPKIKVLVADETSIKEGQNLQIAGRLIRLQTLWTPGAQEQGISRIMRPDVKDVYDRAEINYDWIVTENTLEVAKIARLISKIIYKANTDEDVNPSWKLVADKLSPDKYQLITMSLDILNIYKNFGDLELYFDGYSIYKDWEDREYEKGIQRLKANVEKRTGKKVNDIKALRKLAMVPVDNTAVLEGSKEAYTPWVANAQPIDKYDLDLKPVALVENESVDDDDDSYNQIEVETQQVEIDQPCLTEFGPGYIKGITKNRLRVFVPGLGTVSLDKNIVYIAGNEKKEAKLASILKKAGTRGLPTINLKALTKGSGKQEEVDDITEDMNPSEKDQSGKKGAPKDIKNFDTFVYASTINEHVCLFSLADSTDTEPFINQGYRIFPEFLSTRITNYQGAKALLEKLQKSFIIPQENLRAITTMIERLKTGRNRLRQTKPIVFNDIKNFFLLNSRRNKNEKTLRIWPLVWEDELYLCAIMSIQPKAVARLRMIRGTGFKQWDKEGPLVLRMFRNKKAAMSNLTKLGKSVKITNQQKLMDELSKIVERNSK